MRLKRRLEEAMQAEHEPMIPEMSNEDLIAEYQKRVISAGTVQEGLEITARFAEACRNSEPIPAWVLVIRAMAARIHLLEKRDEKRRMDDIIHSEHRHGTA